ncbi:MAG: helix-turn-helix domain-containing protein [Novosphingobium sp.]|jgi:DNA-binding IclR family transcriptional regulator|nr:helix-turn-helix domain-containing protein [Novosphingobium sp.]
MPAASAPSNKAKIARRVIEVLEYFDDTHREATVMDIVRRYNRPQSSTSELLSSLVELGLLYKDPYSRSYSLAPRAALLGTAGQTSAIRDGRLVGLIDRLVAQTGLSVALFGRVELKAQIVSWHAGSRAAAQATCGLFGGLQEPLTDSAAGWLLLSTIAQPRRDGILRRLNAEASESRKFALAEMAARVQACQDRGHVHGKAGFGATAEVLAVLLPGQDEPHPMAVGLVYGQEDRVNRESLLHCIGEAVEQCFAPGETLTATVERLSNAA